ncbi:hypothetical protein [Paraburkholderia sacchari]|uniref:Chemotaxis protein CheD n=1 Tax=Paraburkholderia sacchari TaxID=159450 RepID=A0A8T6Z525_9BURK|nr:hypothetical protein [Paraburkholderia sacchari]NLP59901.1 hypothetical protein [Paraburkholderia sacchari]
MSTRDVQVRMCEIAVSTREDARILRATLGSCVGIGLLWRAGGANMMHHRTTIHEPIGELNVRMAQQLLAHARVRVIHIDVGGECGRQLTIDCGQQDYAVRMSGIPGVRTSRSSLLVVISYGASR